MPSVLKSYVVDTKAKMSGWVTVEKKKRPKAKHLTRQKALALQHDLDIAGLAKILLSIESKNLQDEGWRFDRVLRGNIVEDQTGSPATRKIEPPPVSDVFEYTWLPVSNKWGDQALFSRKI